MCVGEIDVGAYHVIVIVSTNPMLGTSRYQLEGVTHSRANTGVKFCSFQIIAVLCNGAHGALAVSLSSGHIGQGAFKFGCDPRRTRSESAQHNLAKQRVSKNVFFTSESERGNLEF